MARKKKDGYMPKSEVLLILQNYIRTIQMNDYGTDSGIPQLYKTMTYIEDAPTAEVAEVRHGKWTENKTEYFLYGCSLCGYRVDNEYNFCPECGARMDGDAE